MTSSDNNTSAELQECSTQSAVIDKFTDVRNDVDWVIIDPSDNDGKYSLFNHYFKEI